MEIDSSFYNVNDLLQKQNKQDHKQKSLSYMNNLEELFLKNSNMKNHNIFLNNYGIPHRATVTTTTTAAIDATIDARPFLFTNMRVTNFNATDFI